MAAVTIYSDFRAQKNRVSLFPSLLHLFAMKWWNNAMIFSSVQLLSWVQLCETPWTAAHQASLSIINSRSLLKLMSTESLMPSNYLILCQPLLLLPSIFSSIRVFSNESALCVRWPNIGVSASTSVLPMNIQDSFPLGWTGWISLHNFNFLNVEF